jgi:aspartate racemase
MTKKIGVIGGMGPAASLLFYEMVIAHTAAARDQDHIDMVILSHASMPDRTQALKEGRRGELLEKLVADARMLERCGAEGIAIPCNTTHALAGELQASVGVPLLNIVKEAVKDCAAAFKGGLAAGGRAAVLATDGTAGEGLYQKELAAAGLEAYMPSPESQRLIMKIIYDGVKNGGPIDPADFRRIERELAAAGCGAAILACTELSVFKERYKPAGFLYLDAMLSLAKRAIEFAGARFV